MTVNSHEALWGDAEGMARAFAYAMSDARNAVQRQQQALKNPDPYELLDVIGQANNELAAANIALRSLLLTLQRQARIQSEATADMEYSSRFETVERNKEKVWTQIRTSYDTYVQSCRLQSSRPLGWTPWLMEAWAGTRRRGDDDVLIAAGEEFDPKSFEPRAARQTVTASHLAAEYRDLHRRIPDVVPAPPVRGPQIATGGLWPQQLFHEVVKWTCNSEGKKRCQSSWQPDQLQIWLAQSFGTSDSRYRRALESITNSVLKQMEFGQELLQLRKDNQMSGPDWDKSVEAFTNQLLTRFDFLPTAVRAPDFWVYACPNWRRCGGVLQPLIGDSHSE